MKIKFKEPLLVPNFVQTDNGTISLKDLPLAQYYLSEFLNRNGEEK